MGGGGQGVYALDVTSVPNNTTSELDIADKVLWEFTDADDSDLGYTFSKPVIVRLHNGRWAAIFGNGYNNTEADSNTSTTGNAVLYIVDIENGATGSSSVIKIDTMEGMADDPLSQNRPNGLASVTAADIDGDYIVDYVYGGDLFGNMWKFDLTASNSSNWGVAYGSSSNPTPLFQAVRSGYHQPITTKPSIRRHPTGDGFVVMFGTGKYLESGDAVASTNVESVYGVWDRDEKSGGGSPILTSFNRSHLLEQEIILETTAPVSDVRVVTDTPIQWHSGSGLPSGGSGDYLGWYLDLIVSGQGPEGEIQITDSVVRDELFLFTTFIPNDNPCSDGGESWLWAIDFASGSRADHKVFEIDGAAGSGGTNDTVNVPSGGPAFVSAVKKQGLVEMSDPAVTPDRDFRIYLNPDDFDPEGGNHPDCQGEDCEDLEGDPTQVNRQSWRQLR